MTTENFTGAPPLVDPHQSMGEGLVALQKRNRFIQGIKVTAVWVGLIALATGGMLMLRISPAHARALQRHPARRRHHLYVSLVSIAIATMLALLGSISRLSSDPVPRHIGVLCVAGSRHAAFDPNLRDLSRLAADW